MSQAENLSPIQKSVEPFQEADDLDVEKARRDMALEQTWLENRPRFGSNADVLKAYKSGELELVGENADIRPIRTLLEVKNFATHQPFLRPRAAETLRLIGKLWHERVLHIDDSENVRLPITSMVRSLERQAELAATPGKLALPAHESGHPTGWDFDIDSSSYYLFEDGRWTSVSRRDSSRQIEIGKTRERSLGAIAAPTLIADKAKYDSRYRIALHQTVADLYGLGMISPVVEFTNTPHELIHIGVNPNYIPPSY